jgi:hypothetical protein
LIYQDKFNAHMTDINLKGKMGVWEAARHAGEIDPAFPLVYMSGNATAD